MGQAVIVDMQSGAETVVDLPPPAFEVIQAAKAAAVDAIKDAILTGGYHPSHPSLAGEVLQNRNIEDRQNWDLALSIYRDAVAIGRGAIEEAPFRTASNQTVVLTNDDAVGVLVGMRSWGLQVLMRSWALKDAVAAAEDAEALHLIDISAGWP